MIWRAGHTSMSDISYEKKKSYFGEAYNTQGYEYYAGGIFETKNYKKPSPKSSLVKSFDWRNRHGANNPSSPYFDGDTEGSGWITAPKYQSGCLMPNGDFEPKSEAECISLGGDYKSSGTCWVFGPIGAIEAVTNLYFNQHLDIELSQQYVITVVNHGIGNYLPYKTLQLAKNSSIMDEDCYPFICEPSNSNWCSNPSERIKISDYYPIPWTEDDYKKTLIQYVLFQPLGSLGLTLCH